MFPPGIKKAVAAWPIEKQVQFWKTQLFYSACSTLGCVGISLFTVFNMNSGGAADLTSKVDSVTDAAYSEYLEYRKTNPVADISKETMRAEISRKANTFENGLLLVCVAFTGVSGFGTRQRWKLLREAKSKLPASHTPD